jgi:hypothetical protein
MKAFKLQEKPPVLQTEQPALEAISVKIHVFSL